MTLNPSIKPPVYLFLWLLLCFPTPCSALSFSQEDLLARELEALLEPGQALRLSVGNHRFLALFTEARTPKSRGGIILIHDLGGHPDWPEAIAPLRNKLPDFGWNTLSLQMPLPTDYADEREYSALFAEAMKRISAAIEFFGRKGIYNLVLIGYSVGGAIGMNYVANKVANKSLNTNGIIALVGIATHDHHLAQRQFPTPDTVGRIALPILDIFGSLDTDAVHESAKLRANQATKKGRYRYKQLIIPGADHFFTGLENTLITRLRWWLNKQAPSMEIEVKPLAPNAIPP